MKNVLHLLIGFTLGTINMASAAAPTSALPSGSQNPVATANLSYQTRALQLSCYYTDALRLTSSPAATVKQAGPKQPQDDHLAQK